VAYTASARTTTRRIRIRRSWVTGLLVVIVAIAALSHHRPASSSSTDSSSSSSTAAAPIHVLRRERPGPPSETGGAANGRLGAPGETGGAAANGRLGLGEADGAVPDGTTVFDDEIPGVAKLNADLLGALRRAATNAADDRVQFYVDSGWRSPEYQERLLREAISKYGSEAEATRWVATPETSAHVKGDAVDIGPSGAAAWLSEHGAAYGLCRIYGNEPWHYELRPEAIAHGCPAMYADPTQDPRMQQY
jgi:zinc D-Ala-D-Ala carboxypeptidase